MTIALIDYNAGNVQSVIFALERLGIQALLTADPEQIRAADKVIFPGVGEARSTMAFLRQRKLDLLIPRLRQPLLGICLGMQLLCSYSEENETDCLGIFPNRVRRFPAHTSEKVPHMGWNTLEACRGPVFELANGQYMYYAHSFYVEPSADTVALSRHILPFSAALQRDNFYAVQFHPEKSGAAGARLLDHFLRKS